MILLYYSTHICHNCQHGYLELPIIMKYSPKDMRHDLYFYMGFVAFYLGISMKPNEIVFQTKFSYMYQVSKLIPGLKF